MNLKFALLGLAAVHAAVVFAAHPAPCIPVVRPVRPGGVDGRPFWNRYSLYFLHPPAFEFAPVEGAVKYRFTVLDDVLAEHVFEAERPTADLSPVWKDLPVGYARVTGDARWRGIADRAFAYIEAAPLRTYDWAAQFEDTNQTRDYVGQCSVPAFQTALLLLERFPGDAARVAQARELADWVEDQFVFWRHPCRSDGRGNTGVSDWINCGIDTAMSLEELSALTER